MTETTKDYPSACRAPEPPGHSCSVCSALAVVTIRMNIAGRPYHEDKLFCREHGDRIVALGGGKWTAKPLAAEGKVPPEKRIEVEKQLAEAVAKRDRLREALEMVAANGGQRARAIARDALDR